MAMSVKLLNTSKADLVFKNDKIYQALKQQRYDNINGISVGVNIQALEIKYSGTSNATFTELGTAAPAEFNGSAFEKSTVLCKTMVLTPGGSYFTFGVSNSGGTITNYYAWFSKYQVQTVVCLTAALTTSGTYFTIYDSQGSPTGYYVWLDKNGDGTTDKPTVATLTEVVCDISGATTADDVGVIVAAALDALAGFGASNTTGTVTITHATKGSPSADAVDVDTTYVIAKTQNGGTDPSATGTGAECDIKAATTADSVGAIVAGVINALSDVGCTNSSGTITIINAENFAVNATADGAVATGFTFTRVEVSADKYSGAPLYLKSAHADDTDAAAKDMRKNKILGYYKDANGVPHLAEEENSMNGTTIVKTTIQKWIRLIHHKGSDWGSAGADAKGNIIVEDVGGTDFQLIAATFNESEGGVIWVPNGFHCMIAEARLELKDIVQAITDGAVVKFTEYGFDETENNRLGNLDPDNPDYPIVAMSGDPKTKLKWLTKTELHGTDVAKLTITEAGINNTPDIEFTAYVLLWFKKNVSEL